MAIREWIKTGGVGATGAAGSGGGGGTAPAVGDVASISVSGIIDPITGLVTLTVSVAPPADPLFVGCHLYLEIPDQSSGPAFTLGASALGSSTAALGGTWSPIDLGVQKYDPNSLPWEISIPLPPDLDPSLDEPCRLYAPSYSNVVDNQVVRAGDPGESPNATFTAVSLASGSPTAGTNVTQVPGPIVPLILPDDNTTGKLKTPILITVSSTPTAIPGWACQFVITWAGTDPTQPKNQQVVGGIFTTAGPIYGSPDGVPIPHTFALDTPKTIMAATVWAQAGLVDAGGNYQWNSIVPGVTPSCGITVGSTTGTTDAAALMAASIAATMAVIGGLFGVAPSGISNSFLGPDAVATINIQALAVTNPLLAALAVQAANLSPSSVTPTAIAALAVGTGAIQNAAITNVLIANAAISGAKIQTLTVTGANIAFATIADANIGSCSVAKLTAGTATFSGDVFLSRGSGQPMITLSSTGIILTASSSSFNVTASQVQMVNGGNTLTANASAITLAGSGTTLTVNSSGVSIAAGVYQISLTTSSLQLTNGSNSLTATASSLTLQSGSSTQVILTSTSLTLKTATLSTIALSSAGIAVFTEPLGTSTSIKGNLITTGTLEAIQYVGLGGSFIVPFNISCATFTLAGSGSATLPAAPAGFFEMVINGTTMKVPYYNT